MGTAIFPTTPGTKPWRLPAQGLAVFEGSCDTARLSHYFLPSLVRLGKGVLFLDGANCVDPRLMTRLGRRRAIPFDAFCRHMRICRAFTCFQLTELLARVPKFLGEFPAEVIIVTAFPELYLDEDIRDWDARAAFQQALTHLRGLAQGMQPPLAVAVFSSYGTFSPPVARRRFFAQTCAAASEVWKFEPDGDGKSRLLPVSIAGHPAPLGSPATSIPTLPVIAPSTR